MTWLKYFRSWWTSWTQPITLQCVGCYREIPPEVVKLHGGQICVECRRFEQYVDGLEREFLADRRVS